MSKLKTKDNKINFQVGLINIDSKPSVELNVEGKIEIKNSIKNAIQTFIDNKVYKYIGESTYKKKKYFEELQKRIDEIPIEKVTQPRISTIGPVMDNLNYYVDETRLKEMFTNLLINEINSDTQSKVLPAYVEIIKQLSSEDAEYISKLSNLERRNLPIVYVYEKLKDINGEILLGVHFIIYDYNKFEVNQVYEIPSVVLDNLERLGIIEIDKHNLIYNFNDNRNEVLELCKMYWKEKTDNPDADIYCFECEMIITSFGKQFIDICCN